jgi:hypothetical protein
VRSIVRRRQDYAYEMCDTDSADFYAEVSSAKLTDVSFVAAPINPNALLKLRTRVSPVWQFHDLMIKRVSLPQNLQPC